MVTIIYTMTAEIAREIFKIDLLTNILHSVTDIVLWISAILTVVSGAIYLLDNKDIINPNK